MASEWLVRQIDSSPWKLLEYKRLNPMGLPNQAWKDSETSYLHLDGRPANADGGIAAIEVQGYAYDALLAAARLSAFDDGEAADWRNLATQLQKSTLQNMWMPDVGFFAQGLDRDEHGNLRQIATLTSNGAAILDSRLLLDLPDDQRGNFVALLTRTITGPDFITDAGVRLRALRHVDLIDFADYHGAQVSWPKETYDIAKGLRRHGQVDAANDLERRIVKAVLQSGEFYEFYYVNRDGKVKYRYRSEHPDEPEFHTFGAANTPEPGQAWTLSAFLGISLR
jgi:glycogen debranching enzyme